MRVTCRVQVCDGRAVDDRGLCLGHSRMRTALNTPIDHPARVSPLPDPGRFLAALDGGYGDGAPGDWLSRAPIRSVRRERMPTGRRPPRPDERQR